MDISEEDQDQDQVEILVHISAPSSGMDDAAYRAFATAYLAFEPARRYTLEEGLSDEIECSLPQNVAKRPRSYLSKIQHGRANISSTNDVQFLSSSCETTHADDRMISALKSPDASFKSVLDNMNSPRFRSLRTDQLAKREDTSHQRSLVETSRDNSWQTVSDSQPLTITSPTAIPSPTKMLQAKIDSHASPPSSDPDSSVISTVGTIRYTVPTSSAPSPWGNLAEQPQSSLELPTLPRKERCVDEPERNQAKFGELQTPDAPPMIFQVSSIPSSSLAESRQEPFEFPGPPHKRQRQVESTQNKTKPQGEFIEGKSSTAPIAARPPHVLINPNEIHPPPPKTSLSSMSVSDIITPALTGLVENQYASSWQEDFATRPLRDTERGYWLVNYSTWDPELREESWDFLQKYVGNGTAGWGVRCTKSPEMNELRMYCWGLIVKHIYFLLRVVSKREIKYTGATWFDGGSVAVVVVPPKAKGNKEKSALPR